MTKRFTQWDTDTVGGGLPAGWSRRWVAASSPGTHVIDLAYGTLPVKRRKLTYTTTGLPTAMISWDLLDAVTDVEVLTLVKRDQTAGSKRALLYLRGSGLTAAFNAYLCDLSFSDASGTPNSLTIAKYVAAAGTTLATTAFTPTLTKAYWIRMQVIGIGGGSSSIKVRVWAEDEVEPTAWTLSTTDNAAALQTAGWCGFQATGDGAVTRTLDVNFFSAASGGVSAPKPKTNLEYSAWLAAPNERRILIEISGVGYDSGGSPYTKTVHAYIADGGYTSQEQDTPSKKHYDAWVSKSPSIRREMALALSDNTTASFGTFTVSTPRATAAGPGVRDDWTRVKWNRDYVTVLHGDPTWPRHDFRVKVLGRLGMPKCPSVAAIEFPISDLLATLDVPITRNVYAAGTPLEGQFKPLLVGMPRWVEPVPTSTSTLEQQLNDGSINSIADVYDDGVSLTSSGTIASVDAGTDTITTTAPHGLPVDSTFELTSGSPPAPLALNVKYFIIAAGLGASTLRLAATRGGSAINLTTTTAGASFSGREWWEDLSNGKFTLTGNPSGRIVVQKPAQQSNAGTLNTISPVIDRLIFTTFGLSANFRDPQAFADLLVAIADDSVGTAWYDKVTALQALDELCRGTNCWYGFTPDGLLQVGHLSLPSSSPSLVITESEVKAGSMSRDQVLMPIDRTTEQLRFNVVNLRSGPLGLAPNKFYELLRPYGTQNGSGFPAPGIPLDDQPDQADLKDYPPFGTLMSTDSTGINERARIEAFYGKMLAAFTFQTTLKASELSIGQTIQLTHSRLGWRNYAGSGDNASPDNTAAFDARKAVVIGIATDFNKADPFPVKLTVYRQIPGYYPIADLN